jgi:hypothetical protein
MEEVFMSLRQNEPRHFDAVAAVPVVAQGTVFVALAHCAFGNGRRSRSGEHGGERHDEEGAEERLPESLAM